MKTRCLLRLRTSGWAKQRSWMGSWDSEPEVKARGRGGLLAARRKCRTQKPVKEMGGTESQWLVRGTGARHRGSLRRLLAQLGDKNGG